MRNAIPLLLSLSLAACASQPKPATMAERVDGIIRSAPIGTIAVAYRDLGTGETLLRNEHVSMHAASTMKVPVMVALFHAIDEGSLSLDQPVEVKNSFVSIYDGSTFAVDPKEDSDQELYSMLGEEVPLRELMRRMIVRSSNLATDNLIELVGATEVMARMHAIGANEIQVLRGVEDIKAFEHGMNNTTTAYDMMLVLQWIAEKGKNPESAAAKMIDILKGQEFNEGIPAGLPKNVEVAHKTGSITAIYHDAAIVYPPDASPYILVVMTHDAKSREIARKTVAKISRAIWRSR
ncbi:MAG: serine hydrolase [Thermoanaerobaculia bacterium]